MYKKKYILGMVFLIGIVVFGIFYWYNHKQANTRTEFIISAPIALKPMFEAMLENYQKTNPNVKITLKDGNGREIFGLLNENALDIAVTFYAVRDADNSGFKQAVKQTQALDHDLDYKQIGDMPYVFLVNKNCGVTNLTTQAIHDIFTGKIKNWQELGGKDLPIFTLHTNYASAVSFHVKEQFLPNEELSTCSLFADNSVDVLPKIDKINGAIGYATIVYWEREMKKQEQKNVMIVSINGILPNMENVLSKEYIALMPITVIYQKNILGKDLQRFLKVAEENWQKNLESIFGYSPKKPGLEKGYR